MSVMRKEYIERDAVVKLREEFWKDRCDYMAVRVTNIMNIPAADVAPVVHGEWMPYPSDAYMKCSICRMEYLKSKMPQVAGYCPNCGADMRGAHKNV